MGSSDQALPSQRSAKGWSGPAPRKEPTAIQKLFDVHDKPLTNGYVAPTGSGMLSANQLVPFHRSANIKSGLKSMEDPAAMQTRLDVHETALSPPARAPLGRLGKVSSDQRTPFQPSASGIATSTV